MGEATGEDNSALCARPRGRHLQAAAAALLLDLGASRVLCDQSFVINPLLQAHQKAKPIATKASPGISYEWRAGHCWRPPWRSARLQPCCRPPAWASRMRNLTQASLLQSVGANCVPPAIEFCLRTREPPRQAAGGDIPTFAVRNPNA